MSILLSEKYKEWVYSTTVKRSELMKTEERLNQIFNEIYEVSDNVTLRPSEQKVSIKNASLERDVKSLVSFAIGCIFGRFSLDVEGLVYAGGKWDATKYKTILPNKENILLISDEEYFNVDIVGQFVEFVRIVYGSQTLEENLDFISNALNCKGNSPREIIRNYFIKDCYKDHCQIYQKRPIYWLFDSGKQNGFKAFIYLHRYDENTIGNLRIDYLHRMQRIYENEIASMQDTIDNSKDSRDVMAATKRKEKLIKQLQETKEYDEKIAHLALARISIDLDDGVKVNYEKVQTDTGGNKLDVLAKI